MSNIYPVPERGHVYRYCVMCGRPFRVCNSQLARRGARFCTVRCYHAALRAFREALASDQWGPILESATEGKGRCGGTWRSLERGIRRLVDAGTGFSSVVPARTRGDVPVGLSRRHKISDQQYPA